MAGERLASLLARTPGHQITLAAFQSALNQMMWQVYEVRRAVLPKPGDPGKTGRAARWLRIRAHGTRAAMVTELHRLAAAEGARVTAEDGVERAWLRRRGEFLPAADWFLVAAPQGAEDKKGPGFAAAWPTALAGPTQGELFAETLP